LDVFDRSGHVKAQVEVGQQFLRSFRGDAVLVVDDTVYGLIVEINRFRSGLVMKRVCGAELAGFEGRLLVEEGQFALGFFVDRQAFLPGGWFKVRATVGCFVVEAHDGPSVIRLGGAVISGSEETDVASFPAGGDGGDVAVSHLCSC
jgi:hypothetical protein